MTVFEDKSYNKIIRKGKCETGWGSGSGNGYKQGSLIPSIYNKYVRNYLGTYGSRNNYIDGDVHGNGRDNEYERE